jgi:hypothetical protein
MSSARALPLFLVLLLLAPALACPAQEAGMPDTIPFVSRLKAVSGDTQIKLMWKDSPDVNGENLVFRHTEEIADTNLEQARLLARVPKGVEYYLDIPPDERGYFYAVIMEDLEGKRYASLIPFRNKTSAAVAVTTKASEDVLAARISGISAAVTPDAGAIQVSFRSSNPDRDLIVFWSTTPLRTPEDLLQGTSKASVDPGVQRYQVPALPGVGYYFAVLDAGLYKIGQVPLTGGVNATTNPVEIPLASGGGLAPAPSRLRAFPLPALQLTRAVESGRELPGGEPVELPPRRPVSAAAQRAIEQIIAGVSRNTLPEMTPQVLEADRTPSPSGELAALRQIVTGPLAGGRFSEASSLIGNFLSLPRKPEVEARARFYLGQALYFENDSRNAVMEFLLAEDVLYQETRQWIDACIRRLAAQG